MKVIMDPEDEMDLNGQICARLERSRLGASFHSWWYFS